MTMLPTPPRMGQGRLDEWLSERVGGECALLGLPSVCTSHGMVLEAVVRKARREGTPVLGQGHLQPSEPPGGVIAASRRSLKEVMETVMVDDPQHWEAYYRGGPSKLRLLRHFSYSDRIRYYWQSPDARQAVESLPEECSRSEIPLPLVSQFLPNVHKPLVAGELASSPAAWALQAADDVLEATGEHVLALAPKARPDPLRSAVRTTKHPHVRSPAVAAGNRAPIRSVM